MRGAKPSWRENKDEIAGTLLCVGAMLREWGLPLGKAIRGMRLAYRAANKRGSGSKMASIDRKGADS